MKRTTGRRCGLQKKHLNLPKKANQGLPDYEMTRKIRKFARYRVTSKPAIDP